MHTVLAQFAKNGFQVKMPRYDPTFTHTDLLRLYCNNLDPVEKYLVRKKFKENILHRTAICPTEEDQSDYCAWAKAFHEVAVTCQKIGEWLPEILEALTLIEGVLSALSWAGWIGRLVAFFRLFVLALINFVIYIGAVLIMVGDLSFYSVWIQNQFCKEEEGEFPLEGTPPDPDSLPPNPASKLVDDIQQVYRDVMDWITTPPDWIDDILP